MGAVYLAHDTQLDRPVALKMPHFSAADGPQTVERFYREARAAATVRHPNVCPVYDVGEIDSVPYLTMAYIEGKALAEFARLKPLTPRQAALLVRKLALALQDAHKLGVIHRDLKPANVMIDTHGEPIVMDFGLARRARSGDARLTQNGSLFGTPAYMPPEQVNGNVNAMGPACDIYSLGVLLYELLAGRLPFIGDPMAVLAQVLLDEPPPPSRFRPEVDAELEGICRKAMAKKAGDRYASMNEFAAALLEYLRKKPAAEAASAPAERDVVKVEPLPLLVRPLSGPRSGGKSQPRPAARKAATKQQEEPTAKPWNRLIIGAIVLGGSLVLGAIVATVITYRAQTDFGELHVVTDGTDVEIVARRGGKEDKFLDTHSKNTFSLHSGDYELVLLGKREELQLDPERITIRRGAREEVAVRRIGPKLPSGDPFLPRTGSGTPRSTTPATQAGGPFAHPPTPQATLVWEKRFSWPGAHVYQMALSADGRWVFGRGDVPQARLWEVRTGREVSLPRPGVLGAFLPSGGHLVLVDKDRIDLVDPASGKLAGNPYQLWGGLEASCPAFSRNGKLMAAVLSDKSLWLWGLNSGQPPQPLKKLKAFYEPSLAPAFSPSGKRLLFVGANQVLHLVDVETGELLQSFQGFKNVRPQRDAELVFSVAFLPDGRHVAGHAWGTQKKLIVWDAVTGRAISEYNLGADHHKDLAISPDGLWFLTPHDDHTLRLRDMATGKEVSRYKGTALYRSPCFSGDGLWAAAGMFRGGLELFRIEIQAPAGQ
jgi:hypothetical protein